MTQSATESVETIFEKDSWTVEDYRQLVEQLSAGTNASDKLASALGEMERDNPEPKGTIALKMGIARFAMCRFEEALEAFSDATDNRDRRYFQGLCHKYLRQFDKAVEDLERARSKGMDANEIAPRIIECRALDGDFEQAEKDLAAFERSHGQTADAYYLRGLLQELQGYTESAGESYEQAVDLDDDHTPAKFRLAYFYDLHGHEADAVELYEECVATPPVMAGALLNLAVLYADKGQYERAIGCLRRVLAINPRHERARLFLKDAQASKTMYFDEDQAKMIARRNAVLDIPVTDFELSVRARNCLKKMNIRTLGDLVSTTESELLSYKNFGETSLKEIKDMLSAKGLHLGQALEEDSDLVDYTPAEAEEAADEGVRATPVEQLEFSIRARRALETLDVRTLGDLADKTEADLMNCKNFGQTSLNEIKQRLGEYGLSLKEK